MRVAVVHPSLVVGGGERLTVDMAVELKRRGHDVTIFTNHHDPSNSFEETRNGSIRVQVYGSWMVGLWRRFWVLQVLVRSAWLVFQFVFREEMHDVYIADAVPQYILILRAAAYLKLLITRSSARPLFLFYCHYPDKLGIKPARFLLKLYRRVVVEWTEDWAMSCADNVFVNSQFTKDAFKSAVNASIDPVLLYPGIAPDGYRKYPKEWKLFEGRRVVLSINRFTPLKRLGSAIQAYAELDRSGLVLVIAGGYDPLDSACAETHRGLVRLADELGLRSLTVWSQDQLLDAEITEDVVFLISVSSKVRNWLLNRSDVLVYTPINEHFGLVPVEAMHCGCLVLAMNSGGPMESITDGETGFLTEPETQPIAAKLRMMLSMDRARRQVIVSQARKSVADRFTITSFGDLLEREILALLGNKS